MSEYELPERAAREPTVEDVRELMGASTPHFALQIRNRIHNLISSLPEGHPARVEGEREISRLDKLAYQGELRGGTDEGDTDLPAMPSIRGPAPD